MTHREIPADLIPYAEILLDWRRDLELMQRRNFRPVPSPHERKAGGRPWPCTRERVLQAYRRGVSVASLPTWCNSTHDEIARILSELRASGEIEDTDGGPTP